jgi:HlyD family secretion protein
MKKGKKKWWIIAGVAVAALVVLGLGTGVVLRGGRRAAAQAPAGETAVVERGTLTASVDANGSLAAGQEVALALEASGRVAEVLVEEGDVVEAGQALVRLETDELALDVSQAEISLRQAELQLEVLMEPADQADIDQAQDAVDQAAAALALARISYDGTMNSVAVNETLEDAQSAYDDALADYNYWLAEYNEGDADYWYVDNAQEELEDAELALDRARQQADQSIQSASNDLAAAADSYRQALDDLDDLLSDPEDQEIEEQQLQIEQAQASLDQARLRLEQATLVAPVGGTVTELAVDIGEMASAGQTVVVLSGLEELEVVVNLDETDVAQVEVGQACSVELDAFSGAELGGVVTHIAPVATTESGVVLYPVTVQLDPTDLAVRAGMTADVEIVVAHREDVLLVPLRAVHTEGERAFVDVMAANRQVERVEVELGMITETEAEIDSGLSEGDVVVVVTSTSQEDDGGLLPFGGGGGAMGSGGGPLFR